jgi:hypothetical protein
VDYILKPLHLITSEVCPVSPAVTLQPSLRHSNPQPHLILSSAQLIIRPSGHQLHRDLLGESSHRDLLGESSQKNLHHSSSRYLHDIFTILQGATATENSGWHNSPTAEAWEYRASDTTAHSASPLQEQQQGTHLLLSGKHTL